MPARKSNLHSLKLTKADTVALWRAVDWMRLVTKEAAKREDDHRPTPEQLDRMRLDLRAADRALRKVNAIRKAGIDPRQRSLL